MNWTSPLEFQQQDFLSRWQIAGAQLLSVHAVPHCYRERLPAPMSSDGKTLRQKLQHLLPEQIRLDRIWTCTAERVARQPVAELTWSIDAALSAGASTAVCLARDPDLTSEWVIAGFIPLDEGLTQRSDRGLVRADRLLYGGGLGAYLTMPPSTSDAATRQRLVAGAQHVDPLAHSTNGQLLACSCEDNRLRVWQISTVRPGDRSVNGSPAPPAGLTLTQRSLIQGQGKLLHAFPCSAGSVRSLAFSASSDRHAPRYLASGTYGGTVTTWDLDTGECVASFRDPTKGIDAIAVSADGVYLATASLDSKIRLWDLATQSVRYAAPTGPAGVCTLAFSTERPWLAVGCQSGTISVWDRETGYPISQFVAHASRVDTINFSADGATLYSESIEPVAKLWQLPAGSRIDTIADRPQGTMSLQLQPDSEEVSFEIFAP